MVEQCGGQYRRAIVMTVMSVAYAKVVCFFTSSSSYLIGSRFQIQMSYTRATDMTDMTEAAPALPKGRFARRLYA